MTTHEIVFNLHMHTTYSDGHGSHGQIVEAALKSNLDGVIVTDHNIWVSGPEGYYQNGSRRTMMLIGEELHNRTRIPQKSHLLVFGANRELAQETYKMQHLLDSASESGGLSFLAHPIDHANKAFNENDLSWEDWDVNGYTGIELWNSMTELKSILRSRLHAFFYAFFPNFVATSPFPETLALWDRLLNEGRKVVAIGGSDAHAFPGRMGPFRRTIFPYEYHFGGINTHLLLPRPLSGVFEEDKARIIKSLKRGNAYIGYDLPAPTRGFRFTAQGKQNTGLMGDEIISKDGVTFQICLPQRAECWLIKNGRKIRSWTNRENCTHITSEPGYYRVEVYIKYLGKRRGWIFSNPIYLR